MSQYYDRQGRAIDQMAWAKGLGNPDGNRVARHEVIAPDGRAVTVSTLYLGLDHSFGQGPPLIFETMTFGECGDMTDTQERYSTEAEALAGHARILENVRVALTTPPVVALTGQERPK